MPTSARSALDPVIAARFKGLSHMAGQTPLPAIHLTYRGQSRVLYAKRVCALCCNDPACSEHAMAEIRRTDA